MPNYNCNNCIERKECGTMRTFDRFDLVLDKRLIREGFLEEVVLELN